MLNLAHAITHSRYHKNNAGLDLAISNLKLKETALIKEIHQQQNLKNDALLQIKRLEHDLHEVVQFIQDPRMLREKVATEQVTQFGSSCICCNSNLSMQMPKNDTMVYLFPNWDLPGKGHVSAACPPEHTVPKD